MGKPGAVNTPGDWSPFRAYSLKKKTYRSYPDLFFLAVLFLFLFYCFFTAGALPEYQWNWELLEQFLIRKNQFGQWEAGTLLIGFFTTLRIGFWTFVFSLLFGTLIGLLSLNKSPVIKLLIQLYINIIRNIPPLVILFCVYFFAGNILPINALEDFFRTSPPVASKICGIIFAPPWQLDRMIAAILALGCYQSAYIAEIVRSGMESVSGGQWDAAGSLGFNTFQTLQYVVAPQAIRFILPPLIGQIITTFKDSALASLISLPDLTFQCLEIMSVSNMTFEIWITAALLYLIIGCVCALIGAFFEKRFMLHN